jgi:heme-degrading monooxygenase HmoA
MVIRPPSARPSTAAQREVARFRVAVIPLTRGAAGSAAALVAVSDAATRNQPRPPKRRKVNNMAHFIVHHQVADFDRWKPVFDEHASMRKAAGCQGGYVLRSADDPNEVTIVFDWDNMDNAQAFASSENLREAMQRAGVQGRPDVTFMQSMERFQV